MRNTALYGLCVKFDKSMMEDGWWSDRRWMTVYIDEGRRVTGAVVFMSQRMVALYFCPRE